MIPLAALILLTGLTEPQAVASPAPLVRTNPGVVSVCPDGFADCRLTIVDDTLCAFLAELFDPSSGTFHDRYNCDNHEEGVYVCVNVLGRRRLDGDVKTDYTYPYLVELAADYERQLNTCLVTWQKSRSIVDRGQSVLYRLDRRSVRLSILPFARNSVSYDRLVLEIRDSPPGH